MLANIRVIFFLVIFLLLSLIIMPGGVANIGWHESLSVKVNNVSTGRWVECEESSDEENSNNKDSTQSESYQIKPNTSGEGYNYYKKDKYEGN